MKKQEILKFVRDKANESKGDSSKKYSLEDIENIIQALKECILYCVKNCEKFNYHNFIQVESRVYEPKGRRNPKTNEGIKCTERIKSNVRFCYGIREIIKAMPTPKKKKK